MREYAALVVCLVGLLLWVVAYWSPEPKSRFNTLLVEFGKIMFEVGLFVTLLAVAFTRL
jgi:hypothetical protein